MTEIGGGTMVDRDREQGKGWKIALALVIFSAMVEPGGANRAPRCVLIGLGG